MTSHILKDGPVLLEVAGTLKRVDAKGVVQDLTPRPSDHVVCVVGWTERGGEACWILRNSWGKRRVPLRVPDNVDQCVGIGYHKCRVEWEPWTGMPEDPGFLLLPCRFPPLHATTPSPWMACTVEAKE